MVSLPVLAEFAHELHSAMGWVDWNTPNGLIPMPNSDACCCLG